MVISQKKTLKAMWPVALCASAKRWQGKTPGLLQTVAEPSAPWTEISMDFIVEPPENMGNTVIWVITDLFSKQVHFILWQKIPSAWGLTKLFLHHIYRLHDAPQHIISDWGGYNSPPSSGEAFWTCLVPTQGLNSSHHP